MKVSDFVIGKLVECLERARIVVWYDGSSSFTALLPAMRREGVRVIDASCSMLRARREADLFIRVLDNSLFENVTDTHLLVYTPTSRSRMDEVRIRDPFEGLVRMGCAFGDNGENEHETLHTLARRALPERTADIDRLFLEGSPTLAILDSLDAPEVRWPLIRQALETESAIDAAARVLCRKDGFVSVRQIPGAVEELFRLFEEDLGYSAAGSQGAESKLADLGRYVLLSELVFDLNEPLPVALTAFPISDVSRRTVIYRLCDRMRSSDDTRDGYIALSTGLESFLRLPVICADLQNLGIRDTFPFEERTYLRQLEARVKAGELAAARDIVRQRQRSVWMHLGEREVLWKLAERCLNLLEAIDGFQATGTHKDANVRDHIALYVDAEAAFWQVDRAQRLMEQGATFCSEDDELAGLLAFCRKSYFQLVERMQIQFLAAVVREGWPPEGLLRQTQIFDRLIAPSLQRGHKVVYFLVDALRYEMGRDLAERLSERGTCQLEAVVSALPTTTAIGMAALMPGADGNLSLVEKDGGLIPAVGDQLLPGSAQRMALLKARFGDRFVEMTLDELLSARLNKLVARLKSAELFVIRSQDIDALGEGPSLYRARKVMTEVLGDLIIATDRLARLGFERFVYASDHGHIVLPELPAGDVLSEPPGKWLLSKRRCRLGVHHSGVSGVHIFKSAHLGIQSTAAELAVPRAFATFMAGAGYFHEGLSLQECLLPAISVDVQSLEKSKGTLFELKLHYRSERFSSRIIGAKVWFNSPTDKRRQIRLEAWDGPGARARCVGEAADCDARDPVSGLVTVVSGTDIQVPIRVDDSFEGRSLDIRAIDPESGTVLDTLKLKSDLLF